MISAANADTQNILFHELFPRMGFTEERSDSANGLDRIPFAPGFILHFLWHGFCQAVYLRLDSLLPPHPCSSSAPFHSHPHQPPSPPLRFSSTLSISLFFHLLWNTYALQLKFCTKFQTFSIKIFYSNLFKKKKKFQYYLLNLE